jgi:hypothetical protein
MRVITRLLPRAAAAIIRGEPAADFSAKLRGMKTMRDLLLHVRTRAARAGTAMG